ncbi:MAG: sugar phosphate isomerase/epimerase [Planctomycetes bacterium]|nr:sugar phosphate isomerase/epimerase [Planctomycetota bacterium]
MDNKLGCNTLYPHGRLTDVKEQFTLEAQKQALHDVKEGGFDACEFSHSECLTLDECDALRGECERIGLIPWSAHSWVALPAEAAQADQSLTKLLANLDATDHLGAQVMVVHAAGSDWDMGNEPLRLKRSVALRASLVNLAGKAAEKDIAIAVENCGPKTDLEFLAHVIRTLDLPNVGFNIDTGHAAIKGLDPSQAIRVMGDHLLTTHLQDNFGERDDHLPPGLGTIDWPSVMAAFREVNYTRTLMVEISDCPPGREPVARKDIRQSFENLKRFAKGV